MGWFITFFPLLYVLGAVTFWVSYRSGSIRRDLLLGLAWPLTVPVIAPLSIGKRIRAALKKREALRIQEQEKRQSELLTQERRFIGYAADGTAKWMADDVPKVQDEKNTESAS